MLQSSGFINEEHLYNTPLLLYFTDLEGKFPKIEPLYEVIWVIDSQCLEEKKISIPYGKRVDIQSI